MNRISTWVLLSSHPILNLPEYPSDIKSRGTKSNKMGNSYPNSQVLSFLISSWVAPTSRKCRRRIVPHINDASNHDIYYLSIPYKRILVYGDYLPQKFASAENPASIAKTPKRLGKPIPLEEKLLGSNGMTLEVSCMPKSSLCAIESRSFQKKTSKFFWLLKTFARPALKTQ